MGISHKFEINIATISKHKHNTKGLDFRISDMILQGSRYDPLKAGEMAFKLALIYITVPIRVALQTPFTVSVSKSRRPFSHNFEVFFDKTAKYWEILSFKITLETTDQAQSAQKQIDIDLWLQNSL